MHLTRFPRSLLPDSLFGAARLTQDLHTAVPGLSLRVGPSTDDRTQLEVFTSRVLTAAEQALVYGVLRAHVSDRKHLPTVKDRKYKAIDSKTKQIISKGFLWEGEYHSLSDNAQRTLLGLDQLRNDPAMVYPVKVNSLDDTADAVLTNAAEVHAFFLAAMGTFRSIWDAGTALKDQVRAATTVDAVNAVKDAR